MKNNIPLMKVHMPPEDELIPALKDVLYSGMITEGKKVVEFEEELQKVFSFPVRPLTTNSGTTALQLAYRCADVRGKLVIASPMTCTASNMPIFSEGGRIVWADINSKTGNICPISVRNKIEEYGPENISAISFVDFAGYPADLSSLKSISDEYGIPLIEDAAQSLGARWGSDYIGSIVNYTAFSFQAIKHLTTVDGGMFIPPKDKWDLAKRIKWYGINREAVKEATRWHYDIPDWGYKGHMNNVAATIGASQLKHIENIISKHIENGEYFNDALKEIGDVSLMSIPFESHPSYWIYMVKVDRRDDFAKMMLDVGVGVNVAHIRNDKYTCFLDESLVVNPNESRFGLDEFNDQYIAIPCGWWVTKEDREYIVEKIKGGW
jgi:perosamine synthetase